MSKEDNETMNTKHNSTTTTIPEVISLRDLVKRAGTNLARPRVKFEDNIYDGTIGNASNPLAAISGMEEAIMSEFERVDRSQTFHGSTHDDVCVALAAVMNRSDQGVPQPVSNDPNVLPSTRIIDIGYDWETGVMQTLTVPSGSMSMPGFRNLGDPKKWQPVASVVNTSAGPTVYCNILRADQDAVQGIFGYIEDYLANHTIYAGQVVNQNFEFLNVTGFKPQNVALTDTVRSKIELFVTGPMMYGDALDSRGLPRKSGLFLFGPPGGGKTMVKTTCSYLSARLGAVVIEVDPSTGIDGFTKANDISMKLLENGFRVMIGMEDMEKLAQRDRAKVLDLLDGTSSKGHRRVTVGTTNFLEQIDRAMLRPGRFDAVEFCGLPDLSAFSQLVKVLIAEDDRGDIDYAEAFPYFEGYSYAFISNAVQTIIRAAINRAKGDLDALAVNTQDLIDAALSVRGHFDLMQQEVQVEAPPLDALFKEYMDDAVAGYLENNPVSTHDDNTDYDYIEERARQAADSVIEGRVHGSYITDMDGDERYQIRTN